MNLSLNNCASPPRTLLTSDVSRRSCANAANGRRNVDDRVQPIASRRGVWDRAPPLEERRILAKPVGFPAQRRDLIGLEKAGDQRPAVRLPIVAGRNMSNLAARVHPIGRSDLLRPFHLGSDHLHARGAIKELAGISPYGQNALFGNAALPAYGRHLGQHPPADRAAAVRGIHHDILHPQQPVAPDCANRTYRFAVDLGQKGVHSVRAFSPLESDPFRRAIVVSVRGFVDRRVKPQLPLPILIALDRA